MGLFNDLADVYDDSRHAYPEELRDHLMHISALRPDSAVLDLGAGTGQLAILASQIAASVVAMDPEPDMVRVGQRATADDPDIRWFIGADSDVLPLLGPSSIDLVLIGNAFHHMDQPSLLTSLDSVVTLNGAVVVCSSSTPVWRQDTEWSEALREMLPGLLGRPLDAAGVPDHERDSQTLAASSFSNISVWALERPQLRSADSIIGELISSASGAIDAAASDRLRSAIEPYLNDGAAREVVRTTALIARRNRH